MTTDHWPHQPVLLAETLQFLAPAPGKIYVDGTLGAGGHAQALLAATGGAARLIGIDQDGDALALARQRLRQFPQVTFYRGNFKDLARILDELAVPKVHGILLDLGVSSLHFDRPERGFSYRLDGPLDMRMDQRQTLTAADILNRWSQTDLTRILREYGQERWASRIAQFIVAARRRKPLASTFELVDVIKAAVPAGARRRGPHPARRTFQALRIAVNDELAVLRRTLAVAADRLFSRGRLVVISFHSLEDRIVKHELRRLSTPCRCGPGQPCMCNNQQLLQVLTRRPVQPGAEELESNRRARSAKLRAAEKV